MRIIESKLGSCQAFAHLYCALHYAKIGTGIWTGQEMGLNQVLSLTSVAGKK